MITVIGNMKGGTGKSTVTFNLAVWLAHQKQTITLFDLDPQKTLTDVVEVRQEEQYSPFLPSPLEQNQLNTKFDTQHTLIDVSMSDREALNQALMMADQIIIPIAPSQADIWSTQRFIKHIKQIRTELPILHGLVNRADTHPFVAETKETEQAVDYLPHLVRVPQRLHNRTAYRRSFSEGLGVFELEPNGKASFEFLKVVRHLFKLTDG